MLSCRKYQRVDVFYSGLLSKSTDKVTAAAGLTAFEALVSSCVRDLRIGRPAAEDGTPSDIDEHGDDDYPWITECTNEEIDRKAIKRSQLLTLADEVTRRLESVKDRLPVITTGVLTVGAEQVDRAIELVDLSNR